MAATVARLRAQSCSIFRRLAGRERGEITHSAATGNQIIPQPTQKPTHELTTACSSLPLDIYHWDISPNESCHQPLQAVVKSQGQLKIFISKISGCALSGLETATSHCATLEARGGTGTKSCVQKKKGPGILNENRCSGMPLSSTCSRKQH